MDQSGRFNENLLDTLDFVKLALNEMQEDKKSQTEISSYFKKLD